MKKLITLIAILLPINFLFAQDVELSRSVIASAGSYSEGDNISLSWTVGEIAVTTMENENFILTQGFQQGNLASVGFQLKEIKWKVSAFPNPVVDNLNIQFDLPQTSNFTLEIQDVAGRLVRQEKLTNVRSGDIINIKTSSFEEGVYFFKFYSTDKHQLRVLSVRKSH